MNSKKCEICYNAEVDKTIMHDGTQIGVCLECSLCYMSQYGMKSTSQIDNEILKAI